MFNFEIAENFTTAHTDEASVRTTHNGVDLRHMQALKMVRAARKLLKYSGDTQDLCKALYAVEMKI